MNHQLSCRSCTHYRLTGCHLGLNGWPTAKLNNCRAAVYEPGSDEAEDDDREYPPADEEQNDDE